MGFSNWMLSEYTTPSLSSVDQFGYRMGSKAAELMIDLLKNQDLGQNETIEMKTELVVRGSSVKNL
jgi:LacI family transcriptional regulator